GPEFGNTGGPRSTGFRVSANPSEAGRGFQNHRRETGERHRTAPRCVRRGFSQGGCGDPIPGGEAALRVGKGQSLEPHAHGRIRYVGRGRRCFRSPWRRCAARELPRRPFGLRRPDEAFNPSCHRSEGRGESYRLSRLIGEGREGEFAWSRLFCEAGPWAWFRGQSLVLPLPTGIGPYCNRLTCKLVRQ